MLSIRYERFQVLQHCPVYESVRPPGKLYIPESVGVSDLAPTTIIAEEITVAPNDRLNPPPFRAITVET